MKSLIIRIIILAIFNCFYGSLFSQKTAEYRFMEIDSLTQEVKVVPIWRKVKAGFLFADVSHYNVDIEDRNQWVRKFNKENKGSEYVYLRNVRYDSAAMILITTSRKEELDQQERNFKPIPYNEVKELEDCEPPLMRIEYYLEKNSLFKLPLILGKHIKAPFGLQASKAFTNVAFGADELFNGKISIQFYNDSSSDPIGYYQGYMKNGLADGYGIFVKPYLNNDSNPIFRQAKDNDRITYYVRQGVWKEGRFVQEMEAKAKMDSSMSHFARFREICQIPAGIVPETELVYAVYRKDLLNPGLTNAFTIKYNVKWEVKDMARYRNVLFKESYADFDDQAPVGDVLNMDKTTQKIVADSKTENLTLSGIINALEDVVSEARWSNAYTYQYDDYTLIRETGWLHVNNRVCRYEVETDPETSEIKRTPVAWQNDSRNDMEISTRAARNQPWKLAGQFSQMIERDCYGSEQNYIVEDGDHSPVSSVYQGKINILKTVKDKYPDPLVDTTLSVFTSIANNKFAHLMKRIASSPLFAADSRDPLIGAWYDPARDRIYILRHPKDTVLLCIENGNADLNGRGGYYSAIQNLRLKWMSNNNFRLVANDGLFNGDYSFTDPAANRVSKGKLIHEDLQIQKATADRIDFAEHIYWIRLKD